MFKRISKQDLIDLFAKPIVKNAPSKEKWSNFYNKILSLLIQLRQLKV